MPFLEGPGGDYLVVDMDPTEIGEPGQIVTFWHDEGRRKMKAESLTALMETFLTDLKADGYVLTGKGGLKRA